MNESIEFFSAVILYSRDVERLVLFYRDILGIPLEREERDGAMVHYGCELGDIHFAIHPAEEGSGGGRHFQMAFTIFSTSTMIEHLANNGIALLHEPTDTGFATFTSLRDPDGNVIELTEFRDEWFQYLEERKARGSDVVARWRARSEG
jgi:predicted enzyme related to lactoylglutathione lyase